MYREDNNLDRMRGEIDLLKKENALLKKENAIVKKENTGALTFPEFLENNKNWFAVAGLVTLGVVTGSTWPWILAIFFL